MAATYTDNGTNTPNGSHLEFTYTFPVLLSTDVKVALNGVTQATTKYAVNTSATKITFNNTSIDSTVQESSGAPSTGVIVRVYRETGVGKNTGDEDPKAVFASGSSIRAADLNNNFEQALFGIHELQERPINEEDISDDAVAYAKIQNVTATDRVLGRDSAGAGIVEEIAPAALRTMINVEDGATADQTNTEIRTAVGAASDSNILTDALKSKLDNVSDNANNYSISTDLLDEDNFASDSATKPPSQQSTKAYVGTTVNAHIIDEDDFSSDSATKPPSQQSAKAYIGTYAQPKDADLTTLAGMQSGTASILASSTALTSTTAELNLLDGKSVVTSVSGSSTDVQLPTAKAVNDQIVNLLNDTGGFVPITAENQFPNTHPDPDNGVGTIVSIADAGGLIVNGSGVATNAATVGGTAVTINGIDSTLNSTTIAAGKGMLVQTTAQNDAAYNSGPVYTYHRLVVDEAGVASAQSLVTDFNQRYQVAGSTPSQQPDGTALAEGDLWFDTGSDTMKVYDGSNYSAVTSTGDYKLLTVVPDGATSGTPDYTNVSFDLRDGGSAANITSVGQLLVSVNGVLQKPNSTSWSASNEGFHLEGSNGIKFCTAPGSGASVFVTQIGTATTISVPGTNSIVEAAIQTNVVSEEKLKISNAGTNGQFLSKQSGNTGGLTWASVTSTPEGTAILSTGESGTTKFLRIDGDGTCSWQVPSYTTNTDTQLTTEQVEDIVGGMLDGTETGISVSYDDTDGNIDFVVATPTDITVADESSDTTCFPLFVTAATGDLAPKSGSNLTFNSNTGALAATSFSGDGSALTGVSSSSADGCIWKNTLTISNNHTIAATEGAHSVGPITNNATVTVNGRWVIS